MKKYNSKEKAMQEDLTANLGSEEELELEAVELVQNLKEEKNEFLLPGEYFAENLKGRDGWRNLFEKFPTVTAADLPEQVYKDVHNGLSPIAAYIKNENEELRREIARLKRQETNKKNAIGALGDSGNPSSKDPFLYGFSEAFR